MLRIEETMLLLLAAGRSERYGDVASKLDQPFLTRPLGLHVAVAFETLPFAGRVAITGRCALDYQPHGFAVIPNPDPSRGIATSIALGIAAARDAGAAAVLIALADMPRVTAAHIHRLFGASIGADSVVASSDGTAPMPPALIGRSRFDTLLRLEGNDGARAMIRAGRHVVTSPAELIDVDTVEDLERLSALVQAPIRGGARRSD